MPTFLTKGSTGEPKSFTVSDEFLAARAASRGLTKGAAFTKITGLFCDLSLKTIAGYTYQLWTEQNGVKFFTPVGGTIAAALALFERENIDGIAAIAGGLVNYATVGGMHRFECVLATGSAVSAQQAKIIQSGLGGDLSIVYGASEVGSIALATPEQIETIPGCVGDLCPGVEVRLDAGQVAVKTTTMIDGYDDPALTAKYFKDGWFYPGDLGHFQDGLLVLDGRAPR